MSFGILHGAVDSHNEAHRHAFDGNYETAGIYLEGVIDQVSRYETHTPSHEIINNPYLSSSSTAGFSAQFAATMK
jgi:hypothetical protein